MFRLASLLLLAASCITTDAHRSLPSGVTCSSQFTSPDTALTIPNPKVSWASYRTFTCDEPVFWLEAEADQGQDLIFTVTVPVLERFEDVRISVAFIGPGLPTIDETLNVPDQVRDYVASSGLGIALYESPQSQPTCDHLASEPMSAESTVVEDRCVFYESFGGSNSWVVLDQDMPAPETGLYKIAVFVEGETTAKAAFACCDWPEDFVTNYPIPETDCPFCGTSPEENPAWSSHFYEQKSMEQYSGFPPALSCADPGAENITPDEATQCPPEDSGATDLQPASCVLGCGSDGECHSHNVFGECTHVLNWDLAPTFGEAPVSKLIIFKGDKVTFSYPPTGGSAHNLFQLADEASLNQCDFEDSMAVADVEEIIIGHTITFDEAGTFHFTCGIGCTGFPAEGEEGGNEEPVDPSLRNPASCHCTIGQKLTVEVKDSSEGLRCHDHELVLQEEAPLLICPDGQVIASAVNAPDYGAMDATQCSELCAQPIAVDFMTGVTLGPCATRGFTKNAIKKVVTPPGSPQDVEVRVTTNEDALNCHCHSYEEIACPEVEAPDDTLYEEHIDEIEQYCQGILDETESSCPYRCFQPMEVLHLHYLECPSREVDLTYLAVNATNKCHIAAAAPEGAECPVVELGQGNQQTPGSDTSNAFQVWSLLGMVISFVAALPILM